MAKKRRLLPRLLLFLGSLIVALVLAEVGFRSLRPAPLAPWSFHAANGQIVPRPELALYLRRQGEVRRNLKSRSAPSGWLQPGLRFRIGYDRPRWDYFDELGCVSVDLNSFGFRDREMQLQKRPGELRILALGDSFTFGFGVRMEMAWPQVLEELLQEGRSDPVEVINAGFSCNGHSSGDFHLWVEEEGVRFHPDLVIVGFCLNDMGDVPLLSYPVVEEQPVLGGLSKVLDALVREVRQRRVLAQRRDLGTIVTENPTVWQATQQGLRRLKEILDEKGIPLLLVVLPMLSELDEDMYPYRSLHEMVHRFCDEAGIRHVDLMPVFLDHDAPPLWVDVTDQHPNHIGQRMIGEAIAAQLRSLGLAGQ